MRNVSGNGLRWDLPGDTQSIYRDIVTVRERGEFRQTTAFKTRLTQRYDGVLKAVWREYKCFIGFVTLCNCFDKIISASACLHGMKYLRAGVVFTNSIQGWRMIGEK